MSIFKKKNINSNLFQRIVAEINQSKALAKKALKRKDFIEPKEDELEEKLTEQQMRFVKAVSGDMNEEEIQALKRKVGKDGTVIRNYKKRNMLKDPSTGEMKPKEDFAIDVDYPARGFRAITSHS
ncbi:MAG: hypothetical protein ABJK28_09290 [Algibacter sp.]